MATASLGSSSPVRIKEFAYRYLFEVNYLKLKHLPTDQYISSPPFTLGGYEWAIRCWRVDDRIVFWELVLLTEGKDVRLEFSCALLRDMVLPITMVNWTSSTFTTGQGRKIYVHSSSLEFLGCKDGVFVVCYHIRVLPEQRVVAEKCSGELQEHMEKLLQRGENFDVTFEVEGASISAHRLILAARSPVFQALLFGPMAEANMKCIKMDDMKAEVFEALLHFIYTDELAIAGSRDIKQMLSIELVRDLFVAADRYALEKLRTLCEDRLCQEMSVDIVTSTLVLADRHNCARLKETCLEFASKLENFVLVPFTEGYLHMMQSCPSLGDELSERVNGPCGSLSKVRKKKRTG